MTGFGFIKIPKEHNVLSGARRAHFDRLSHRELQALLRN